MIELLFKASFFIGIALLFYKCVLQQENFFATNRLYLLCCILLAFALPYIELPKLVEQQGWLSTIIQPLPSTHEITAVSEPVTTTPAPGADYRQDHQQPAVATAGETGVVLNPLNHTEERSSSGGNSWAFWLLALYFFGVLIFTLNLLFQTGGILLKAIRATDKIEDTDCTIVNTAPTQAPCSFFRYIFIYPDDYSYDTYEQIIAHEKIHIRMGHSLDLLVAEIAVIMLWFNPLIWLLKKEIEKNIEFQTDAILLEETAIDKEQYQLSLLQIAAPHKPLSVTTNYNQSLLKQRILMMNAKKSTLHSYWKYAFLAPVLFGTLLLLNEPATSHTLPATTGLGTPQNHVASPADAPEDTRSHTSEQEDMSEGYWYSHQTADQYCLKLTGDQSSSNWSMTECFAKALIQKKEENSYQLTRESGTLTLVGALNEEVSQGKYKFTKDPSFEKFLADNNISSTDKNLAFFLFLNDVGKSYITFLKNNYKDVSGERLLEVAIHGISLQEYQAYIELFQKYGNKKPSMQEVVGAKIHGIDEEYVREMQSLGFKNLSLGKMMEARIHDVNKAYVEELKRAGFENLPIDKVIEAKIHDLDAASIQDIRALGYDMDLDKILEVKIHDVDARYIQELKNAGFNNLDIDQVLQAKIHDLDASEIKEIQALGFKDISFNKMIEIQIHDVDAAFIKELAAAGFTNLSADKILEARIHDVDGNFIKRSREKGYKFDKIDRYIELKIHGMARNFDRD